MQQYYQDAIAIIRHGKSDLFMTCNPKREELKEIKKKKKKIPEGITPNDIPNITVRLIYTKFKMFLNDIIKPNIFGQVLSHVF